MHPSALLCFGVYLTPHIFTGFSTDWYCCNAAPSFSDHTYDIPLRDVVWVIFWVRGTLCCTLKGCMHSIGRSTALTPIGRSKSRVHNTALYSPPHYCNTDCCTAVYLVLNAHDIIRAAYASMQPKPYLPGPWTPRANQYHEHTKIRRRNAAAAPPQQAEQQQQQLEQWQTWAALPFTSTTRNASYCHPNKNNADL